MSDKIELSLVALGPSESQPGNFTLVLEESRQQRRIPITIGPNEAQAIAMSIEKMQPLRPLTHDLLKNTIEMLKAVLEEVLLYEVKDEVFYAKLYIRNAEGQQLEIDARPSDALALAVRFDVPVYTYEAVIEAAGIMAAELAGRIKKGSLAEYSILELEELLKKLVQKEDFESAARIRDYLEKRRNSG